MIKTFLYLKNLFLGESPTSSCLRAFFLGLVLPLGFAPFHLPLLALFSLAFFYLQLSHTQKQGLAFWQGFFFGLAYFGLGISWIFVSIHNYGHLNIVLAAFITLLFISYLSLFTALQAFCFVALKPKQLKSPAFKLVSGCLFSSLWVLAEWARGHFLTGFPWLLLGYGQIDLPLKYFLPLIGVYGLSFLSCFVATLAANLWPSPHKKQFSLVLIIVLFTLGPLALKNKAWIQLEEQAIPVNIIQGNISMKDKWDERLFFKALIHYQSAIESLLGKGLIVLPESAIPLSANYLSDFLHSLDKAAKDSKTAILLGLPVPSESEEEYFNSIIAIGKAKGIYFKQHLVPFGEYIPRFFQSLSGWLAIPDAALKAGEKKQTLMQVFHRPIASLICYELAYGELLRPQLPKAQWIVSLSDDGWFGHSFAPYQHIQMAQVRSMEAGRYQIVANNDGLSALIDSKGQILTSLPAFQAGILETKLFPAKGLTPWATWGDKPIFILISLFLLVYISLGKQLVFYPLVKKEDISLSDI